MKRGDGWNVLILLSFLLSLLSLLSLFCYRCFALLSGTPGREYPIYFVELELDKRYGRFSLAFNSRHVHYEDPIPAPAAKVHDPSIMATFPALPAY